MKDLKIVKRDGQIVPYDSVKILNAIRKAFDAQLTTPNPEILSKIIFLIISSL